MTTYNTGNPVEPNGSADPRDLYDNSENLDKLVVSRDVRQWPDRLGVPRWSWWGMEQRFAEFLANSGYQFIGDYAPTAGIEITEYNQVVRDADGNLWRLNPSVPLPYTTDGSGMDEGGAFIAVGDGDLRNELVQPVGTFDNVLEMTSDVGHYVGRKVRTAGYHQPGDGGGAPYEIIEDGTGVADGGSIIQLPGFQAMLLSSDSQIDIRQFGPVSDGSASSPTDSYEAIQACFDYAARVKGKVIGAGDFYCSQGLFLDADADLSPVILRFPALTVPVAFRIGGNDDGYIARRIHAVTPEIFNADKPESLRGWDGMETSIGLELATLLEGVITVTHVANFGVNLKCGGYTNGFAYCTVIIGVLWNGKTNLLTQPEVVSSDDFGWANSNTFIGGRLMVKSQERDYDPTVEIYQLALRHAANDTDPGFGPNNNHYIGLSVEGAASTYHLDCAGASNEFIGLRWEFTPKVRFYAKDGFQTSDNQIIGGFFPGQIQYTIEETGTGNANFNRYDHARSTTIRTDGIGLALMANGAVRAHLRGYRSNVNSVQVDQSDTNWIYQFREAGLEFKRDVATQVEALLTSRSLKLGRGSIAPAFELTPLDNSRLQINAQAALVPHQNGTVTLGDSTFRWEAVYATSGTINTSDAREKSEVSDLSEAEIRVAGKLRVRRFKLNDAVERKGDAARWHIGFVAQEVIDAFQSEGIDPFDYGAVCHDQWEDQYQDIEDPDNPGELKPVLIREAGDLYSVRENELYALMMAARP